MNLRINIQVVKQRPGIFLHRQIKIKKVELFILLLKMWSVFFVSSNFTEILNILKISLLFNELESGQDFSISSSILNRQIL